MQEKKVYLYNELLIEMQKCHRNKQYEQMSEIYAEIDRIIYGEDECIPESNELNRLENKTFFVSLLEDNSTSFLILEMGKLKLLKPLDK